MPIPIKKLKSFGTQKRWVLKHKTANHEVASGFYRTREDAERDLNRIPGTNNGRCDGNCGVGCRSDYEVVEVVVTAETIPTRKLIVKSV